MLEPFMPSIFPSLLSFAVVAPFLLRIIAGFIVIRMGLRLMHNPNTVMRVLGIAQVIVSLLVILGLFTQISVILLTLSLIGTTLYQHTGGTLTHNQTDLHVLLIVTFLALLFLGPGIFALDFPF